MQVNHPIPAGWTIALDRTWLASIVGVDTLALEDFLPDARRYVVDFLWVDEDSGDWLRKTMAVCRGESS